MSDYPKQPQDSAIEADLDLEQFDPETRSKLQALNKDERRMFLEQRPSYLKKILPVLEAEFFGPRTKISQNFVDDSDPRSDLILKIEFGGNRATLRATINGDVFISVPASAGYPAVVDVEIQKYKYADIHLESIKQEIFGS